MDNNVPQDSAEDKIRSFIATYQQNKKLFILSGLFFIFLLYFLVVIFVFLPKNNQPAPTQTFTVPTLVPTTASFAQAGEIIKSLSFDPNCHVVVTTSTRTISLAPFSSCATQLFYKISPNGQFVTYIEASAASQLITYSLQNNVQANLDALNFKIQDMSYDVNNNLALLFSNNFYYYIVSALFQGYPGNFDSTNSIFTNLNQNKVKITLPLLGSSYAKIQATPTEIDLLGPTGQKIYALSYNSLLGSLTPTQSPTVDRESLDWSKRVLVLDGNSFKTVGLDGTDPIVHNFSCNGVSVVPLGFFSNFLARSPDGRELFMIIPTEIEMRQDPNWVSKVFAKQNPFSKGDIAMYDLVHDQCSDLGLNQTLNYQEKFSVAPNGSYLAYVDSGISLYDIQAKKTYQLAVHNSNSYANPSAVTGPLVWDAQSKFIYTSVINLANLPAQAGNQTNLVRAYFDNNFSGNEQTLLPLTSQGAVYTVSPDGQKIAYSKNDSYYIYNINSRTNTFLANPSPAGPVNKIVWLRNGTIVSDKWIVNPNSSPSNFTFSQNFQIDYGENDILYDQGNAVSEYSLVEQKLISPSPNISGNLLNLFY